MSQRRSKEGAFWAGRPHVALSPVSALLSGEGQGASASEASWEHVQQVRWPEGWCPHPTGPAASTAVPEVRGLQEGGARCEFVNFRT